MIMGIDQIITTIAMARQMELLNPLWIYTVQIVNRIKVMVPRADVDIIDVEKYFTVRLPGYSI